MFTSLPCLFLFSHRNKLGLKRHMKKNAKMQDICNKETKMTAASLNLTILVKILLFEKVSIFIIFDALNSIYSVLSLETIGGFLPN